MRAFWPGGKPSAASWGSRPEDVVLAGDAIRRHSSTAPRLESGGYIRPPWLPAAMDMLRPGPDRTQRSMSVRPGEIPGWPGGAWRSRSATTPGDVVADPQAPAGAGEDVQDLGSFRKTYPALRCWLSRPELWLGCTDSETSACCARSASGCRSFEPAWPTTDALLRLLLVRRQWRGSPVGHRQPTQRRLSPGEGPHPPR